jgi:hypothetical protein
MFKHTIGTYIRTNQTFFKHRVTHLDAHKFVHTIRHAKLDTHNLNHTFGNTRIPQVKLDTNICTHKIYQIPIDTYSQLQEN